MRRLPPTGVAGCGEADRTSPRLARSQAPGCVADVGAARLRPQPPARPSGADRAGRRTPSFSTVSRRAPSGVRRPGDQRRVRNLTLDVAAPPAVGPCARRRDARIQASAGSPIALFPVADPRRAGRHDSSATSPQRRAPGPLSARTPAFGMAASLGNLTGRAGVAQRGMAAATRLRSDPGIPGSPRRRATLTRHCPMPHSAVALRWS